MSFVIQRSTGRGGVALNQVRGDALRIGRGTNTDLRSDNPAVALEHAVIEERADGYTILDKGSITGTYVNGKPVESATLKKGDQIEIGDLRIEVQVAEAGKPLFLRLLASRAAAAASDVVEEAAPRAATSESGGAIKAPKIDYVSAFKLRRTYFTKVTVIALLMILSLAVIAELTQSEQNQIAFMPGGVSSAHNRALDARGVPIANNCRACHDAWQFVSDSRCQTCHNQGPHATSESAPPPCAECHQEHRGATQLVTLAEARCVSCHGNLQAHIRPDVAGASIEAKITSFGVDHPDFDIQPDRDTLNFNHELHLAPNGVLNAEGQRENLSCDSCHALVQDKGRFDPVPVNFEQHCQRCHKLTFDARFPQVEVPHGGDSDVVYGYIVSMYSGNQSALSQREQRRTLTERANTPASSRAARTADHVMKAKCAVCHVLERKGDSLVVVPPMIPTRWYQASDFSHTQHRDIACEDCHNKTRSSSETADVLIPGVNACTSCHGGRPAAGAGETATAASGCTTCHNYHDPTTQNLLTTIAAPRGHGRTASVAQSNNSGG